MAEKGTPGFDGGAIVRSSRARGPEFLRRLEWTCFGVGTALVLFFAGARFHSAVSQRLELAAFDLAAANAEAAEAGGGNGEALRLLPEFAVNPSLWAEGRVAKFRESLIHAFAPPLAVLRIPSIGLEVPVLRGTDELTLNRAVGAVAGTAAPGEAGNVGIAGHRDGFFRGLKDVRTGDAIELETLTGNREYRVVSIGVVAPTEVSVLAPTPEPVLTLITCYPFYFVGDAPQRYVIRAEILPATNVVEAGLHR